MVPRTPTDPHREAAAFSLVEILSVIAVLMMMMVFSTPVLQLVKGSASINKAIDDLSGTYEMARIHAMTHHTYTRVGIAKVPAGGNNLLPSLVIATIYAVSGSLESDDAASMADDSKWRLLAPLRGLNNLWIYDGLEGSAPSTSGDIAPSSTDIAAFERQSGSAGKCTFGSIVQFNPAGEARVLKTEPARHIKIGVDQPLNAAAPETRRDRNPFILRLSGINGSVNVIRKENLL